MNCDLHMHSTASDGTDAPADLPRLVQAAGLGGFALTDHDTTAGLPTCADAARAVGIRFVPGIELSADPASVAVNSHIQHPTSYIPHSTSTGTLHLLGYFIRHDDPKLERIQTRLRAARAERNPRMVERLNELGVRISYDEVVQAAGGDGSDGQRDGQAIIGRPHIAQVMVARGYVKSIHEAFTRYIGEGGAAYTRKDRLCAADAVDAIHHAGGVACLAHPVQLKLDDDALEIAVRRLTDLGLDGLETRHNDHAPADIQRFERLAERFGLIPCGGSDYHGTRKSVTLGEIRVPMSVLDRLSQAAVSLSPANEPG